MSTCCLCSSPVSGEFWNKPIFESQNFVVIPSLGSLVEGWVLIIPRKHHISMGALSPALAREMERVKLRLGTTLRAQYGDVCAFEHGPAEARRRVGCGVDHAHLHVVPLGFDLASAATPYMPSHAEWVNASWESCRLAFEKGQDYLYLEQPLGSGRIAIHRDLGSQVFRRAVAARLGTPEQFNWRDHPQEEVIARTIRSLGAPADTRL